MKLWITTVHPPGCVAHVFGVHRTSAEALAKLKSHYTLVERCGAPDGDCRCEFSHPFPHLHGTAKERLRPPRRSRSGGWMERTVLWTANELELE